MNFRLLSLNKWNHVLDTHLHANIIWFSLPMEYNKIVICSLTFFYLQV
jgi:hypothetical protein